METQRRSQQEPRFERSMRAVTPCIGSMTVASHSAAHKQTLPLPARCLGRQHTAPGFAVALQSLLADVQLAHCVRILVQGKESAPQSLQLESPAGWPPPPPLPPPPAAAVAASPGRCMPAGPLPPSLNHMLHGPAHLRCRQPSHTPPAAATSRPAAFPALFSPTAGRIALPQVLHTAG